MLLTGSRNIARLRQWKPQCLLTSARSAQLDRIPVLYNLISFPDHDSIAYSSLLSTRLSVRCFATGTEGRPASRPKAHTGRTPAKRQSTAKQAGSTTKKAATSTKKASKPKKKPAKKSKKPKKKVVKTKAKPKRTTRVLTEKQKQAKETKAKGEKIRLLKEKALTPPSAGSKSAFLVFHSEHSKNHKGIRATEISKEISTKWKQITPEQREHYNHVANQNIEKHDRAYKAFITSHSPLEIYEANSARRTLAKKYGVKVGTKKLKDERQVTGVRSAYIYFNTERQRTGDYVGMDLPTRSRLITKEWQALSAAEQKPYQDKAEQDRVRYSQERKTVLGKDSGKAST